MKSRITPEAVLRGDVTPEEARQQMITDMKPLVTTARRVSEMYRALAQQHGKPEYLAKAAAAEATITRLDAAIAALSAA